MVKQFIGEYRARASTEMVVAAIIASVTFIVGFKMLKGYDAGGAILSNKRGFELCFLANTSGLIFSTMSLILYFITPELEDPAILRRVISVARTFSAVSLCAVMVTYASGTY